jgi:hypothetical protein
MQVECILFKILAGFYDYMVLWFFGSTHVLKSLKFFLLLLFSDILIQLM